METKPISTWENRNNYNLRPPTERDDPLQRQKTIRAKMLYRKFRQSIQFSQYSRCRSTSRLLSLPLELRLQIYTYVLFSTSPSQGEGTEICGLSSSTYVAGEQTRLSLLALLLVCKSITEEVLDHFYRKTTFELPKLAAYGELKDVDRDYRYLSRFPHLDKIKSFKLRVELTKIYPAPRRWCMEPPPSYFRHLPRPGVKGAVREVMKALTILKGFLWGRVGVTVWLDWKDDTEFRTKVVRKGDDEGEIVVLKEEDQESRRQLVEYLNEMFCVRWRVGEVLVEGVRRKEAMRRWLVSELEEKRSWYMRNLPMSKA